MMIPGTQDLQLIVELSDPGVLERIRSAGSSTPASRTERLSERNHRVALDSQQALAYREEVGRNQGSLKTKILQVPGAQVLGSTDTVMNAVIVRVPASRYGAIRNLPGVKKVYFSRPHKMLLDQAATVQNAQALWTAVGGSSNAGLGVKIGIIDTGIDITNKMFSGSGMSAPSGFPKYDSSSDHSLTNAKVIAARSYVSLLSSPQSVRSAVDEVGHGTFVAGCAAGQSVAAPLATISGMAPGAYLGSYKIFGTPGINDTTTTAAVLAAINDAVADGMDVINLSMGGLDYVPPAEDPEAVALENAVHAGVTVVIAAGNDGSMTHSINNPGNADGAITVGSVTGSREFLAALHTNDPNLGTIGYLPSGDGISVASDMPYAGVVDVSSLDGNGLGCSALPSTSLNGSVALIERGTCTFAVKVGNAAAAGAKAVIVYNNVSPGIISMSGLTFASIPAVMISNSDGVSLKQFINSNLSGAQVSIGNAQMLQPVPTSARVVSSFSAVGPGMDFNIKPDMVAVGENVYSATESTRSSGGMYDPSGFTSSSGTSFSTPMVTGAAAALRAHFPSLGASAIKSLLTTTAGRNLTVDGTNAPSVIQAGNGLLNMGNALAATAVFSPTSLNFGVHSYSGSLSLSQTLTIQNISSSPDQFTFGFEPMVDGASVSFSQTGTGSIPPQSTATVDVSIQVTAPNSGGFQGFVTARSSATSFVYRIPYWAGLYVPNPSRVLQVSQSGSGNGSFSSISDALASAQPGNIIEIQDSATYSLGSSGLVVSTNSQGVPLHGVTVRAASGQSPIIDGSALGSSGSPADIQIVGLRDFLLKGLTLNGGYTGVQLYQPSATVPLSATLDNCVVSNTSGDNGAAGVWIDGGGSIEITHSSITNSSGTGIVAGAFADGTQLTVLDSTVQGNGYEGVEAWGTNVHISGSNFTGNSGTGAFLDYCSGTVEGSTFSGNQSTFQLNGDGLQIADGEVTVRNNIFDSNVDAGLALLVGDKTGLGPDVRVVRNTMHGNGNYGLNSNPSVSMVADGNLVEDNAGGVNLAGGGSSLLTNNIIVRSTGSGLGDGMLVGSGTSARLINNTIYQNALHGVSTTGTVSIANSIISGNKAGDLQGVLSNSLVSSLVSKDPSFVNAGSDDFSLAAGSPAIDAGSNSVSDLPFLDYSGRLRVSSSTGSPGQGIVDIGAEESSSKYPLIYPLVVSGSQANLGGAFRTGIAFSNPTSSAALIGLEAYGGSGAALAGSSNPASESLGIDGQLAILDYELFGYDSSVSAIGSVLASSATKLVGFDLICDPNFSQFSTGASASTEASTDLVFMRHQFDSSASANYVIFNPGVNTANVTATLFNASGGQIGSQKTFSINPKGQTTLRFDSANVSSGYVRIQSDRPVSGVEVVGNASRQAALGGFSPDTQARLFFPHLAAGGGYSTQVGIVNSANAPVNLNLTAYDDNGNLLGTRSGIALAPGGQLTDTIANLFGISETGQLQTGYLIAQSDQPGIMGYTDFTFNDGVHNPDATIPADSVPSSNLYFSHVAQGAASGSGEPYETGIALLNPFGTDVAYTISVYNGAGTLVARTSSTIGPHQKVAKILSHPTPGVGFFAQDMSLGNGHVEVSTDYGLIGLELFFTNDLSQLASVPAQVQ